MTALVQPTTRAELSITVRQLAKTAPKRDIAKAVAVALRAAARGAASGGVGVSQLRCKLVKRRVRNGTRSILRSTMAFKKRGKEQYTERSTSCTYIFYIYSSGLPEHELTSILLYLPQISGVFTAAAQSVVKITASVAIPARSAVML